MTRARFDRVPRQRNDQIFGGPPIGGMVFPGTGIQDNFADKAKNAAFPSGVSAGAVLEAPHDHSRHMTAVSPKSLMRSTACVLEVNI